ncbi:CpaF family protein [Thauera chlorobenzoica]|uniref:Type II/IV secretion system ATP hydrolase TadA n=1 Tax=Thauera chlorobenzoica TaxID=96773 RepID=A0A1H5XUX0_9RHOO|nr:CpaF family protein [Thauera chlorobenzoica]APR04583.1 Type II/IV secretion system ATP hydrolase TadA [Thauera chlorobenzoica]SEG15066.1 pilus assembly protein CpaF [Thauera chlorobenzoica]
MSLRQRLESVVPETAARTPAPPESGTGRVYQALKMRIHQLLLSRIDLEAMEGLEPDRLREELRLMVERLLTEENIVVNTAERRDLVRDIQHEMLGLGPIEPLLADPTVSDILINGSQQVYVERHGKLELTNIAFSDDDHLMKIIDKIVSRVGRRIDESSPMVDARLPDGSRVNAIIPPLALDGPSVSIRRFAAIPLTMDRLLDYKSLTPAMSQLLADLVQAKVNILISGGTGSGKTTLLNILSAYIPTNERIVTIEDAAELQLQQPHVVRLETRPPNIEGKGEVTQRALVRNALRMRPDRIILGETRGGEAFDVLQAMNTGHEGSMTTVHANSPRDALGRMENMLGMAGVNLPQKVARAQIASAIGVIVQVNRLTDGKRKVVSIQEITGMEGDMITMQEVFSFRQQGINDAGVVDGFFSATGVRPHFAERLRAFGIRLTEDMFDPSRHFE